MVLENFSKFVSIHLNERNQEKKSMLGNNMQFFNEELSSAHKKEHNLEIVISKNDLIKIKSFILNNENFVLFTTKN